MLVANFLRDKYLELSSLLTFIPLLSTSVSYIMNSYFIIILFINVFTELAEESYIAISMIKYKLFINKY